MKIKTIDINCKEWFDRINGNSYFAGEIVLNYGTKKEETFIMSFQYGYGNYYIDEAKKQLTEHNYISCNYGQDLWSFCKDNNIILRTSKEENCLKRELKKYSN